MATNYYEELLQKLKQLNEEQNFTQVKTLLEEELRMPYIPSAYQSTLEDLYREVSSELRSKQAILLETDPETLKEWLNSDQNLQLKALDTLSRLNMRDYMDVVNTAFAVLDDRLLLSLLTELCIGQQLRTEVSFTYDGMTYTFIPATLEAPGESEGVQATWHQLCEWLENDDPSMLKLCGDLLQQTALLKLPQNIEEVESKFLAAAIVKDIILQLSDVKQWQQFAKKHKIKEEEIADLN